MNLSIKARLAFSFTILALLSGGQGAVSIVNVSRMKADLARFKTDILPSTVAINDILDATSEVRIKQYRMISFSDSPQELTVSVGQYLKARQIMAKALERYEPLIDNDVERRDYPIYLADWRRYEGVSEAAFKSLTVAGKPRDALNIIADARPLFDRMRGELDGLVKLNNLRAIELTTRSTAAAATTVATALLCMVAAVCAALAMMLLSLKDVSNPIAKLTGVMQGLASGDTRRDVPFVSRRDEIGAMAVAVEVFKANMIQNQRLEAEAADARTRLAAERRHVMVEMADQFETNISDVVLGAASRAADMRTTASELADTATETAQRSANVAMAARETESSALSIATAASDLGQSVHVVHQQVDGSADLARVAVAESRQAEALINELLAGASKIGDIVSMIAAIASQTNLLAINATIEAAVAQEAGRGFAVVALEVKALAKQTSSATQDIGTQIGRIQALTNEAVAAIHRIGARIVEMSELAASIVASVSDQETATQRIVRSIETAAGGTQQVTGNIAYVAGAADATGTAAKRVFNMASDLVGQSQFLRAEVDRFLSKLRAA